MNSSLSTVLIANRGEIALRAIRVCRRLGLRSVAVHSRADASSPHVWAADRAVCIGPAAARDSYLNLDSLLHVAEGTGCDAVYPGYGFLSEHAGFAGRCEGAGLKFVGPSAETIRIMGDKSLARATADRFGVPVVPGSTEAFVEVGPAAEAAAEVGYPLLLKARSGGGGRGMRVVATAEGLASAFAQATREAEAAFGDGALYLERFFPRVRHIEVQVLGDGSGGAVAFDERDCSVQRRHQKLVEESPSPAVGEELRARLCDAAAALARGIRYEGAGTVEFIYDPASGEFFFIEMNTRIQVEHPVTEMRAGIDLVEAQFRIAAGESLETLPREPAAGGHAIEFRINAENWRNGFTPAPGRLDVWRPPAGPGIRLDCAVGEGQQVSPYYDSMIAKLVVHGAGRDEALTRARAALAGFRCEGIATTIGFHRLLVDEEAFVAGDVHTRWIENDWRPDTDRKPD